LIDLSISGTPPKWRKKEWSLFLDIAGTFRDFSVGFGAAASLIIRRCFGVSCLDEDQQQLPHFL
jgi:hypothetical protein